MPSATKKEATTEPEKVSKSAERSPTNEPTAPPGDLQANANELTDEAEAPPEEAAEAELSGPALPIMRRGLRGFFFYLFGLGLLSALARGIWWVLGGRTTHQLHTVGRGLRVQTRRAMLGRTIHVSERRHRLSDVDSVEVGQGFSGWPLWLGAICFAIGILLGGSWIGEGARTGETYILMVGAVVLLAGSGADFVITLWHRQRRGHATLCIRTWDGRAICIGELAEPQTRAFVQRLGLPQ